MIVVWAGITNVVEQKEGKLDIRYQKVKGIGRKKSVPHLESDHWGVFEAFYTFLLADGGKGIGESNQALRECEKALLTMSNILRLLATYSILLVPDTLNMNSNYKQMVCPRAELSQLCPAWLYADCYSSVWRCLDLPDASCVGLFDAPSLYAVASFPVFRKINWIRRRLLWGV